MYLGICLGFLLPIKHYLGIKHYTDADLLVMLALSYLFELPKMAN